MNPNVNSAVGGVAGGVAGTPGGFKASLANPNARSRWKKLTGTAMFINRLGKRPFWGRWFVKCPWHGGTWPLFFQYILLNLLKSLLNGASKLSEERPSRFYSFLQALNYRLYLSCPTSLKQIRSISFLHYSYYTDHSLYLPAKFRSVLSLSSYQSSSFFLS